MRPIYSSPEEREVLVLKLRASLFESEHRTLVALHSWKFICEIWVLVCSVSQAYFYDWLLYGELFPYGIRIFHEINDCYQGTCNDVSWLSVTFPPVTNCYTWNSGPSGGDEYVTVPCVLPLNWLYSWVFLVLWVWFVLLTVMMIVTLSLDLLCLCSYILRLATLMRTFFSCDCKNIYKYDRICRRYSRADIHMIFLFKKNIDPAIFSLFLDLLASPMEKLAIKHV